MNNPSNKEYNISICQITGVLQFDKAAKTAAALYCNHGRACVPQTPTGDDA